jgi:hypothetical protein
MSVNGSCIFQIVYDEIDSFETILFFNTPYKWDPNTLSVNKSCSSGTVAINVTGTTVSVIKHSPS